MQTVEPEPPLNRDQLLQMLSLIWKQMENQQTEIIWLCEVAAREKEGTVCVQTRLLKQIGTQWVLRSFPIAGRNTRATPSLTRTRESAHFTGSSSRVQSEIYEDNDDSENFKRSRTAKFSYIEDNADLVQKRLNQARHQFPKGLEYSGSRPTDSHCQGKSPRSASRGSS